jgi:S-DNA-T family DNA segregation ATPase FtsK/SpoIIIE
VPSLDLLVADEADSGDDTDARHKAEIITETLDAFGIPAQVVEWHRGPVVTQFGVEPGFIERLERDGTTRRIKIRVNKILSLTNDLALALAAAPIRIEAPVPGRSIVGIEVPNDVKSVVGLRGVVEAPAFRKARSGLSVSLGRDVSGEAVVADLAAMPHLLIAGATGSGKSVCLNACIVSLLYQNTPDQLKLLFIDPKRVELTRYNGIPHLLAPVVVDVDKVISALRWVTREMERRYKEFAEAGIRDLAGYNSTARKRGVDALPKIVVVIDELADLMMAAPEDVERTICRLAQMARATGIHLVIATQRPSVDVVTGLIKANFPARISFAVTSQIDSRVILDTPGAEKLLGRGDMLFMAPDSPKLQRIQGCWVSDREVEDLVSFLRRQWAEEITAAVEEMDEQAAPWDDMEAEEDISGDKLVQQAITLVRQHEQASASFLQRQMRIGYPRAARLIDELESLGIIGPAESGGRSRSVLDAEDGASDDASNGDSPDGIVGEAED